MRNYIQPGNTVTLAAPTGGVSSGDPVLIGSLFGVCATDALEAAAVEVSLVGVFTLPKATGAGINQGAKVYWDVSESNCTATATDNTLIGAATETAGSSDTTVKVRLNGITA